MRWVVEELFKVLMERRKEVHAALSRPEATG